MNNYSGSEISIFEYYNNHKDRQEDGTYCLPLRSWLPMDLSIQLLKKTKTSLCQIFQ